MFAECLLGRAMRSLITIERNLMRQSALGPEGFAEERLGGGDIRIRPTKTAYRAGARYQTLWLTPGIVTVP
jgi:hypothetical protein